LEVDKRKLMGESRNAHEAKLWRKDYPLGRKMACSERPVKRDHKGDKALSED